MKYVDEFRDGGTARHVAERIALLTATLERPLKFMEVCGGHTHTIFKYALHQLLPAQVELVHGPGCPVCVLPVGRVDEAIGLAMRPGVILTTFGDAMRVPGNKRSLLSARAAGADVRMVYSPLDALQMAVDHPQRHVVFFGIGFETTTPSTASAILQAAAEGIDNFSIFANHVSLMPGLRALLDSGEVHLDGFVGPGHVSTIIGTEPYEVIARNYRKSVVVSGFEPNDIMQSIYMLVTQTLSGRPAVLNQYTRTVRLEGNRRAREIMERVYEPRASFEWRGLGEIPLGGLRVREEFSRYDAERRFEMAGRRLADPKACQCGDVLKGVKTPWECKIFGKVCTPRNPVGSCMVSSEGACAAAYNYGRLRV
jgi:hydrogenase expression/formation protein HypD